MKKSVHGLTVLLASGLLLAACSNEGDNTAQNSENTGNDGNNEASEENMNHDENMNQQNENEEEENDTEGQEESRSTFEENFAELPESFNEGADEGLQTMNTKNITRLEGENTEHFSITASQTIWPATHEHNQPGAVILADPAEWEKALAALSLVHHPNDGPLLLMEDGLSEEILAEIERLSPKGNEDGVEILAALELSDEDREQLDEYEIDEITEEDPAAFAKEVEDRFTETIGERPENVLIGTMNEEHKIASITAGSWITHMNESILYVDDEVPEPTKEALEEREGSANIYVMGGESAVSEEVVEELREYGNVERIGGDGPVDHSIDFAAYEDDHFGWGIDEPGHGLVFASPDEPELALAGAPLAHLGKHAPMIWVENDELEEAHVEYLARLKPSFEEAPMEGPYNHGYILGGEEIISFQTQGIIDDKMEIQPLDGGGHDEH
ncbi:MAG: cell wall-binding repeat-containing protein [Alkalicoccus sp.]|nr:MAG: cell wall-binding repeat-containing protein [Alkalicoccus sp.]